MFGFKARKIKKDIPNVKSPEEYYCLNYCSNDDCGKKWKGVRSSSYVGFYNLQNCDDYISPEKD